MSNCASTLLTISLKSVEPKNGLSAQPEAPSRRQYLDRHDWECTQDGLTQSLSAYAAPEIIDTDANVELQKERTKKKTATTKKAKQVGEIEEITSLSSSSSDEKASSSESDTGSAGSEDVEDDDSEVEITTTKLQQRLELEVCTEISLWGLQY